MICQPLTTPPHSIKSSSSSPMNTALHTLRTSSFSFSCTIILCLSSFQDQRILPRLAQWLLSSFKIQAVWYKVSTRKKAAYHSISSQFKWITEKRTSDNRQIHPWKLPDWPPHACWLSCPWNHRGAFFRNPSFSYNKYPSDPLAPLNWNETYQEWQLLINQYAPFPHLQSIRPARLWHRSSFTTFISDSHIWINVYINRRARWFRYHDIKQKFKTKTMSHQLLFIRDYFVPLVAVL
jgi:hypothetical protein